MREPNVLTLSNSKVWLQITLASDIEEDLGSLSTEVEELLLELAYLNKGRLKENLLLANKIFKQELFNCIYILMSDGLKEYREERIVNGTIFELLYVYINLLTIHFVFNQ